MSRRGLRPTARGCEAAELPRVTTGEITYLEEVVAVDVPAYARITHPGNPTRRHPA